MKPVKSVYHTKDSKEDNICNHTTFNYLNKYFYALVLGGTTKNDKNKEEWEERKEKLGS